MTIANTALQWTATVLRNIDIDAYIAVMNIRGGWQEGKEGGSERKRKRNLDR